MTGETVRHVDDDDEPLLDLHRSSADHSGAHSLAVKNTPASESPVTPAQRRLTMSILLAINLLNYLDRYTVAGTS
jgi:hypothetical protein